MHIFSQKYKPKFVLHTCFGFHDAFVNRSLHQLISVYYDCFVVFRRFSDHPDLNKANAIVENNQRLTTCCCLERFPSPEKMTRNTYQISILIFLLSFSTTKIFLLNAFVIRDTKQNITIIIRRLLMQEDRILKLCIPHLQVLPDIKQNREWHCLSNPPKL